LSLDVGEQLATPRLLRLHVAGWFQTRPSFIAVRKGLRSRCSTLVRRRRRVSEISGRRPTERHWGERRYKEPRPRPLLCFWITPTRGATNTCTYAEDGPKCQHKCNCVERAMRASVRPADNEEDDLTKDDNNHKRSSPAREPGGCSLVHAR